MNNAFGTVQVGGPERIITRKIQRVFRIRYRKHKCKLGDLRNLMKDVRFGEGNFATDSILFPMINSLGKKAGRGIKKAVSLCKTYMLQRMISGRL